MKKYFKWEYKELLLSVLGLFLYCLSINIFIVPNNLYNGGVMGLSQLLRTLILNKTNINVSFDIASLIYYLINIPLFYLAYKKMGKTFFYRTIFCVTISTLFLLVIPKLNSPITDNLLTNILIGGVLCGFGSGLAISSGASTGGTDIIGMVLTKKFKWMKVGTFNLSFNVVIYGISCIIGGIETMVYSILYSIFDSLTIDKMHLQNINSEVLIFTKKNPRLVNDYIKNVLDRDFTYWEAKGGYTDTRTYITYCVLSKYEKLKLEYALKEYDANAFIVASDGMEVKGEFQKKL